MMRDNKNNKFNNIDPEQWKYTDINKFISKDFKSTYNVNYKIDHNSKYDIVIDNDNFIISKNCLNSSRNSLLLK